MISHGMPAYKHAGRVKLHMTSNLFFFHNFSPFPNDKILGRSKLEYLQKTNRSKSNLTHELFSFKEWKILKKRENCWLTAFSSFLSVFFKSFRHQSASLS